MPNSPTPNAPGMQCHDRTLVLFVPGPNTEKQKEFMAAHLEYMRRQMRLGAIIAAGPLDRDIGAAAVFASSNWTDVEALLKDEPLTKAGVIRVTEHRVWSACQSTEAKLLPAMP